MHPGTAAGPSEHVDVQDPRVLGAGIGLRSPHIERLLAEQPRIPWLELLADNHLAEGGLDRAQVEAIADRYPLTLHCVSMNLGGPDPIDRDYLRRVVDLKRRSNAAWVSDHLCFTAVDGRQYHDLLPLPYTDESLRHVAQRVEQVQDLLGAPLVVENVSSYLRFAGSWLTEAELLAELVACTGCRLLLDVNNLYVNHINHGEDLDAYLDALPLDAVVELHLGGHQSMPGYLLDAHNNPVSEPVWRLYERITARRPEVPVLIEWDNDIPSLEVLMDQARIAKGRHSRLRLEAAA